VKLLRQYLLDGHFTLVKFLKVNVRPGRNQN